VGHRSREAERQAGRADVLSEAQVLVSAVLAWASGGGRVKGIDTPGLQERGWRSEAFGADVNGPRHRVN
jgi:hypothetical protein